MLAVGVATALADADGVELISSEPLSNRGANTVQLDVAVEGAADDVAGAVASIREWPAGRCVQLEVVAD